MTIKRISSHKLRAYSIAVIGMAVLTLADAGMFITALPVLSPVMAYMVILPVFFLLWLIGLLGTSFFIKAQRQLWGEEW